MKKALIRITIIVFVLLFADCGASSETPSAKDSSKTEAPAYMWASLTPKPFILEKKKQNYALR